MAFRGRLQRQVRNQTVLPAAPTPSRSSFRLPGRVEAHCDLGSGVSCNENVHLWIFALNLAYSYVGLSYCCRFRASIFSVDSLRIILNLVVTVRSRLGQPPREDTLALLLHGGRRPCECSCSLSGLCWSRKGPKRTC